MITRIRTMTRRITVGIRGRRRTMLFRCAAARRGEAGIRRVRPRGARGRRSETQAELLGDLGVIELMDVIEDARPRHFYLKLNSDLVSFTTGIIF